MPGAIDPNRTVDEVPSDPLDAGLAVAFGADSGPPLPAAGSVVLALGADPVVLRDPATEPADPVVKPHSDAVLADAPARLRIDGEIARGGMGAVLKGRDTDLGRDVAVKVLLETHQGRHELVQRFVEEAQIAGQLQHPGVVPVYEMGQFPDKRPYFTMKLVKGQTLARLLAERTDRAQERPRFLGIFLQVCQALAYAHARGVIHRDLKPSNVMVGAFGEVQVMDWGLAKVLKEGAIADEKTPTTEEVSVIRTARSASDVTGKPGSQTQAGQVMGTPAYMAPEQARGEVDRLDARCDVFGLGAILCQILTGQPPYVGSDARAVYAQAAGADLAGALTRLGGCGADAELIGLARRCLAAERDGRPRDAGTLEAEGAAYLGSVEVRLRRVELERAAAESRAGAEYKARRRTRALALAVLLGDAGPGDLRQRLDVAEAELRLVKQLDIIRQRRATMVEGKFDTRTAERDYAAAFRDSGLGEVGDDETAVAARVHASGVAGQLVAALDDWATVVAEPKAQSWLLEVTRRAAPVAWGDRFRAPAVWGDRQALRVLADEPLRDDGAKLEALSPQVLESLGRLLRGGAEAVPLLRAAQRRYPNDFWLSLELGHALDMAKQTEEAVGYYRVAVALRPDASAAHNNLGTALYDKTNLDGAIATLRKAIELDAKFAKAHYYLGIALLAEKDLDGATAEWRLAIELDPKFAEAHYNLGISLLQQGRFGEARTAIRRCLELLPQQGSNHLFVSRQLQWCERLLVLDEKLPAIRSGETEPADAAERVALAQLCLEPRRRCAAAARLYAETFADDPKLADDLSQRHHYNAACSAAFAASGQGHDAKNLPDKARLMLRRQALGWLRAGLALYAKLAERDDAKQFVRQQLKHWREDTDLASVRDKQALEKLPTDERDAWRQLWADVDALLKKVQEKPK